MDILFAQSIIQFANLRVYARVCTRIVYACKFTECEHIRIVRDLFPKAVIDEHITDDYVFRIAWSFLSESTMHQWFVEEKNYRIGGLPAIIYDRGKQSWWYKNEKAHRDDRDPRTGLTLPATICADGTCGWFRDGNRHRDDRDPRTGLTLPAIIYSAQKLYEWLQNGNRHRDDRDPRTGAILPALIYGNGAHEYWINGVWICK